MGSTPYYGNMYVHVNSKDADDFSVGSVRPVTTQLPMSFDKFIPGSAVHTGEAVNFEEARRDRGIDSCIISASPYSPLTDQIRENSSSMTPLDPSLFNVHANDVQGDRFPDVPSSLRSLSNEQTSPLQIPAVTTTTYLDPLSTWAISPTNLPNISPVFASQYPIGPAVQENLQSAEPVAQNGGYDNGTSTTDVATLAAKSFVDGLRQVAAKVNEVFNSTPAEISLTLPVGWKDSWVKLIEDLADRISRVNTTITSSLPCDQQANIDLVGQVSVPEPAICNQTLMRANDNEILNTANIKNGKRTTRGGKPPTVRRRAKSSPKKATKAVDNLSNEIPDVLPLSGALRDYKNDMGITYTNGGTNEVYSQPRTVNPKCLDAQVFEPEYYVSQGLYEPFYGSMGGFDELDMEDSGSRTQMQHVQTEPEIGLSNRSRASSQAANTDTLFANYIQNFSEDATTFTDDPFTSLNESNSHTTTEIYRTPRRSRRHGTKDSFGSDTQEVLPIPSPSCALLSSPAKAYKSRRRQIDTAPNRTNSSTVLKGTIKCGEAGKRGKRCNNCDEMSAKFHDDAVNNTARSVETFSEEGKPIAGVVKRRSQKLRGNRVEESLTSALGDCSKEKVVKTKRSRKKTKAASDGNSLEFVNYSPLELKAKKTPGRKSRQVDAVQLNL